MEHIENTIIADELIVHPQNESTDKPFIQANTIESSLEEIKSKHIIPVFIKDNETLISHSDFIDVVNNVANDVFDGETILKPTIRLSHPIKGRTPDAKQKPVHLLDEREKTIYYERMAFIIEIPSISSVIDGCTVNLTIGGVKSYSLDNLYNRKGAQEHFKLFVGFQNKVCTNLCVMTDGAKLDIQVTDIGQLMSCAKMLLERYNM